MLPIVFFVLFAGCLGLWAWGAPLWLVFGLAIATWAVFYFVIYPKVRTYRVAMGVDDKLNSIEDTGWQWVSNRLSGFRVLIVGFLTSTLPFLGDLAQWLNGQNLDFFLDPSKPERKQMVTFVIGAVIFAVPFLTSWIHSRATAEAATTDPKPVPPGGA